jgi:hypothetical protein
MSRDTGASDRVRPEDALRQSVVGLKKARVVTGLVMSIPLPIDLKNFVTQRGLFEGITRDDGPGYVVLWPIEDIPKCNAQIEIETSAPGFLTTNATNTSPSTSSNPIDLAGLQKKLTGLMKQLTKVGKDIAPNAKKRIKLLQV